MWKKYTFLLLAFLFTISLNAQNEQSNEEAYDEELEDEFQFEKVFFMGTNFQLGFPQGILGRNIDYTGWGFGGNIMWPFKRLPLYGGLDFGFQNSAFEADIFLNSFNENIETRTKNSIVLIHLQFRYYPEIAFKVKPYAEAMIGVKGFVTRTIVKDVTTGSNETINSEFNKAKFPLSFGGAVGFEIPLMKNYLFLDMRCAYLKGTTAEYYAKIDGNPSYNNTLDAFELKTSFTDLLVPQIGVKFMIGLGENEVYEEEYYEEEY